MEDTDSSGTRKRPRLDSGEHTYRSMSADRPHNNVPDPDTIKTLSLSQQEDELPDINTPVPPITPTKVTINVRDPQTNSAAEPAVTSNTQSAASPSKEYERSSISPSESPKVVSVHSTPTSSPEIQVAEVEDMSDDPSATRWKPIRSIMPNPHDFQSKLLESFPFASANKSLRKTLNGICSAIENGKAVVVYLIVGHSAIADLT